jgi:hypothetical protein
MKILIGILLFVQGCNGLGSGNNPVKITPAQSVVYPDSAIGDFVRNKTGRVRLSTMGQQIVHLNAGPQPGVNASGKSNITFVADHGLVIFTSQIKLGNTLHIKFDGVSGFEYAGTDRAVFGSGSGNNVGDTILNFDFGHSADMVFDAITKIFTDPAQTRWLTWDGTPQSAVFYGLYVGDFKISGKTTLYQGPWEPTVTYHMVTIAPTFNNGIVVNDGTADPCKIHGLSIYGLKAMNWKISGPTRSPGTDVGIFFIQGTAALINIHRNGGYGYLLRLIPIKLGGIAFDQTCGVFNCVDVNSVQYGTVDFKMDIYGGAREYASHAAAALTGTDVYFLNNTSGDKTMTASYVVSAVVLGALKDDDGKIWTIHLKNNFAFNAQPSSQANNSSFLKNNSGGLAIIDSSNNIDLVPGQRVPAGLLDSNYYPLKGSFLDLRQIGAVRKPAA